MTTNLYFDKNPRGFGLMQRDRRFEDYQDDGVFYNKRPSAWAEPVGEPDADPDPTAVVASRTPRGSAFLYTLDQPATVKIKIYALAPGRLAHGRCQAPSKRNKSKPKCTQRVLKGTLTRSARAGPNTVPFSGRIGHRALAPDRYEAAIMASNAGGSTTSTVRFTIVAN